MELIKIRLKAVADSGFVQQKVRAGGISLDLLSQLIHENAQVVGLLHVGRPPDLFEDLPVGHDPAGIPDENRQ